MVQHFVDVLSLGVWGLPFIILGVYANTAYPTVSGGDSGEVRTLHCFVVLVSLIPVSFSHSY